MIPYAELEKAIARWKARQAGHDVPNAVQEVTTEVVVSQVYAESTDVSGLHTLGEDVTKH